MAQPDDLAARRLLSLREELGRTLALDGSVVRAVDGLGVDVERWREAARAAGDDIRRPVHTGSARGGAVVFAALTDWPRTPHELLRAGLRASRDS